MDLCTVISQKFIPHAINLIQSYRFYSDNEKVFVYYFNVDSSDLNIFKDLFGDQIVLREVEEICSHALDPLTFVYKAYAINDCLTNHSTSMIYSDSANCFVQSTRPLEEDLLDQSLFLPYENLNLVNKYWTTKRCLEKLEAPGAESAPQYWAGFQVYKRTSDNIRLVTEMLEYLKDPAIALPNMKAKRPDGSFSDCVEHRCDQSVLSILLHKYDRHQPYDAHKCSRYGDWQTIVSFNNAYKHDIGKMILSPRESKFGNFRFLKNV